MQRVLHHACFKLYTSTLQITGNQTHYIALEADGPVVVCTTQSCVCSKGTFPVQSVDTTDYENSYFPSLYIIYLFKHRYFVNMEILNLL